MSFTREDLKTAATPGVSIVVCTFNGKKNLEPTLRHIADQKGIENIPVELIVVDNASTDGTSDFVRQRWAELASPISMVLLQESRPGKAHASQLAFNQCHYAYILVCDDDNWLCETYVRQAFDIMSANARIGVLGGKGEGIFEDKKPEWFDRYQGVFAVGEQHPENGDVTGKLESLWGAGMVFRKEAWDILVHMNYQFFLNEQRDKKGNWGGDDSELCLMIVLLGYNLQVSHTMTYKHFMPQQRMSAKYLQSRFLGLGRSRLYLQAYIYCMKYEQMPNAHLKYPLWLDRMYHLGKIYLSGWLKYFFVSDEEVSDPYLKFLALKGELYELWKIKGRYKDVFAQIFRFKQRITTMNLSN